MHQSILEYTKVYQSVLRFTKVCQNVLGFVDRNNRSIKNIISPTVIVLISRLLIKFDLINIGRGTKQAVNIIQFLNTCDKCDKCEKLASKVRTLTHFAFITSTLCTSCSYSINCQHLLSFHGHKGTGRITFVTFRDSFSLHCQI